MRIGNATPSLTCSDSHSKSTCESENNPVLTPDRMIYLTPGRNEDLDGDLGLMIRERAAIVGGRALVGDFIQQPFSRQLALISEDLKHYFWDCQAILVGRSYGAYLLLHALADLEPFPGYVLLFSPVLGQALSPDLRSGSKPPRAQKLLQLAQKRMFPPCRYMEVHTGANDNGCDPELARTIVPQIKRAQLFIVPHAGHHLSVAYIREVLDRFTTK